MVEDEERFWNLIAVLKGTPDEESVDKFHDALTALPAGRIEAFDRTLTAKLAALSQEPSANRTAALPRGAGAHPTAAAVEADRRMTTGEERLRKRLGPTSGTAGLRLEDPPQD